MNYLFLDIDGVLNSWCAGNLTDAWINRDKVERLNKILPSVDRLVLSSDWRRWIKPDYMTIKGMSFLFSSHGIGTGSLFEVGNLLYDVTSIKHSFSGAAARLRSEEILEYVETKLTPEDCWAVLDDLFLDLGDQQFRFIQTDPMVGLQEWQVEAVLNVLKKE